MKIFHTPHLIIALFLVFVVFPGNTQERRNTALIALLEVTQHPEQIARVNTLKLDAIHLKATDPLWPVVTFLQGEVYRLRGEADAALRAYQSLVEWAATDPYHDTWGGSGLATVALWRWTHALAAQPAPEPTQVNRLLTAAEQLRPTRLMRTFFKMSLIVIDTFPQMEEDLVRQLARVAYAAGKTDAAQQYFLQYLALAQTADLDATDTALYNHFITSGAETAERLALLRGKRMMNLQRYADAEPLLRQALNSKDTNLQAEANLYFARLQRYRGENRETLIALLNQIIAQATQPDVIQDALYERAITWNRRGKDRNEQEYLKDMQQILRDFPQGRLTDTILSQLAQHYESANDLDNAFDYYAQLRQATKKQDVMQNATVHPALLLYQRNVPDDRPKAIQLLQELETKQPTYLLHHEPLFWLGRMLEETGDTQAAHACFRQIIQEAPYDYYALRARMHLALGAQANTQLWPDAAIKKALREVYQPASSPATIELNSPYALRLQQAFENGLYQQTLTAAQQFTEQFQAQSQETTALAQLDQSGFLTSLSLLLAFRQDVIAAKDQAADVTQWLPVVRFVSERCGDWPLAMNLVTGANSLAKLTTLQHERAFLATAYPPLFKDLILQASRAYDLPPEILYGIMRRESLFYPAALSSRNALGLFQFIPSTFQTLDQRWKLLKTSGLPTREAFLINPEMSIPLGARWVKQELFPRYEKKGYTETLIPFALMAHNAGSPAVQQWIDRWQQEGRLNDIEYMLVTIRYTETRMFTRRVLTDMILVDAIGLLK